MAKNVHDDVLDAALNYLKDNADKLLVLSAEPTGASAYTNATTAHTASGYLLADAVLAASGADFTGPAEGVTSGRRITVDAQSSMAIDGLASAAAADATHVALVLDAVGSSAGAVLYTTTCTTQSLTGGNTVNTPAWDIEIRDPA
jgi:hypothetical protein